MRIAAVGDSNACGDYSFIAEAGRLLGSPELTDYGVGGERTRDVYARVYLGRVTGEFDLAILLVGTNDVPYAPWGSLGEIRERYPQILQHLKTIASRVVACTVHPWASGHETWLVQAANGEILKAAREEGVEVFDLYGLMANGEGKAARPADYHDEVHFSAVGRARAGLALADLLMATKPAEVVLLRRA